MSKTSNKSKLEALKVYLEDLKKRSKRKYVRPKKED